MKIEKTFNYVIPKTHRIKYNIQFIATEFHQDTPEIITT